MHITSSGTEQSVVTYAALPDGTADVWIRKNQRKVELDEYSTYSYDADEVYFKVTTSLISQEEIERDSDFFFLMMSEKEGCSADEYQLEAYRTSRKKELSEICRNIIYRGVEVELSTGAEHFSLTAEDQINLFGKQAQIAAGATSCEYHQDGCPCKYYSAEDMLKIIESAMRHKSYHTTYANSLNMWIADCDRASELSKIQYGMDIPGKYQSDVLRDYHA